MTRLLAALALAAGLVVSASAQFYGKYEEIPKLGSAQVPSNATSAGVRVDQKLNDVLPLDLTFKNEAGDTVALRNLFQGRPVLLLPIFYECTGICTIELNKLMEALNAMKLDEYKVGRLADVIIFSIDPSEGPNLAAAKKETYLSLYKKEGTEQNWSFLTGSKENVAKLTDAIGFRYRIDGDGQITHPGALIIVSPTGKISRYFLGTEYPTRLLINSLRDAAQDRVGERDEAPFFMACVTMDPLTGRLTLNIVNTLKTLGVLTLIGLVGALLVFDRQAKARGRRWAEDHNQKEAGQNH
ncbi:MAG: SCO family protein [Fimbriimonadaceae bacterium]|nr:SCO family protein [Fimbriimonadaceae bacterium]